MPETAVSNYDGALTDADVVVYHQVGIPYVDHARAKRLGFGKKSGRERLMKAMRIAFRRYLDDIEAGRVAAPEWDD